MTYLDWAMILITTVSCVSMMFETPTYRVQDNWELQVRPRISGIISVGRLRFLQFCIFENVLRARVTDPPQLWVTDPIRLWRVRITDPPRL